MAEEQKHVRFAELLRITLNNKIKKKFSDGRVLDNAVLHEVRDCVRETITDVFAKSKHALSEKAREWVANQYFKSIEVGTSEGKVSINELIVLNDHKLSDMSFSDIQLMTNLFNETSMYGELQEEYRRRSTS